MRRRGRLHETGDSSDRVVGRAGRLGPQSVAGLSCEAREGAAPWLFGAVGCAFANPSQSRVLLCGLATLCWPGRHACRAWRRAALRTEQKGI